MERPDYRQAVNRLRITDILAEFDPHIVGTPPLGLAVPGGDIDIVCHAPDPHAFATRLWQAFSEQADFSLREWINGGRPVIAAFTAHGWPFEVFGAADRVRQQAGWRHFAVEQRLLALGGEAFRAAILRQRQAGLKTEPAFATCLHLPGTPYAALLELEAGPDDALARLLAAQGFPGIVRPPP
jgi:hypothetical protein